MYNNNKTYEYSMNSENCILRNIASRINEFKKQGLFPLNIILYMWPYMK